MSKFGFFVLSIILEESVTKFLASIIRSLLRLRILKFGNSFQQRFFTPESSILLFAKFFDDLLSHSFSKLGHCFLAKAIRPSLVISFSAIDKSNYTKPQAFQLIPLFFNEFVDFLVSESAIRQTQFLKFRQITLAKKRNPLNSQLAIIYLYEQYLDQAHISGQDFSLLALHIFSCSSLPNLR